MQSPWLEKERQRELDRVLATPGQPRAQQQIAEMDRRLRREGLSLKTRITYARKARQLALRLDKPVEEAMRPDLEAFLDDVAERCGRGTVVAWQCFLKSFYKRLLGPDGPGHPDIVAWIRPTNRHQAGKLPQDLLSTDEVRALAQATTHPRDRALVMVLYESAARATELLGVRVGDVDFDEYGARVTLRGKTGMRRVRLLDSVPDLQGWLNTHPLRDDPHKPLWLSWGHQNYLKPLRYTGLRRVLASATRISGIRKRVHPHLMRHSRLTELAKTLSESELKVFAGWSADSSMAKVYIHLSGDDVDRKMLEKAGLLRQDRQQKSALEGRTCPRCREKNSATASYCSRCTMPLDEETAREWENEFALFKRHLPELRRIIQGSTA